MKFKKFVGEKWYWLLIVILMMWCWDLAVAPGTSTTTEGVIIGLGQRDIAADMQNVTYAYEDENGDFQTVCLRSVSGLKKLGDTQTLYLNGGTVSLHGDYADCGGFFLVLLGCLLMADVMVTARGGSDKKVKQHQKELLEKEQKQE
jgi:hypothetical protein